MFLRVPWGRGDLKPTFSVEGGGKEDTARQTATGKTSCRQVSCWEGEEEEVGGRWKSLSWRGSLLGFSFISCHLCGAGLDHCRQNIPRFHWAIFQNLFPAMQIQQPGSHLLWREEALAWNTECSLTWDQEWNVHTLLGPHAM